MGKATIISGGEEGLYRIRVNLHRDNIDATIAKMQAEIAALDDQLTEVDKQITLMDAEIAALASNPTAQTLKIQERLAVYIRKNTLTIKIKALQRRIAYLEESMPEDPEIDAWCADFSEDLTGAVGTVEVPGERGTVLIRPGFESAAHDPARDGVLEPAIAADPAGACYNLAMLPGWQKWRPTYRFGTITSLNESADTCNVTLETAASSAQAMPINQTETLTGVPIVYMDGNAEAFEDGDDILIEFIGQDWGKPRVIGFKDNPRNCDFHERFGDNKTPTDYNWVYTMPTPTGVRKVSYLDGSNFVLRLSGQPYEYEFGQHIWNVNLKPNRKLKQYMVIKTAYIENTMPGAAIHVYVYANGPGIIWGGELILPIIIGTDVPNNVLNYPYGGRQTLVYDFYAPTPIVGTITAYPNPKNKISNVSIATYAGGVVSCAVAFDSIRITNTLPEQPFIWMSGAG